MPRRQPAIAVNDPLSLNGKFLVDDETTGSTNEADFVLIPQSSENECLLCEEAVAGQAAIRFEQTDDFIICLRCLNANLVNRSFTISTR